MIALSHKNSIADGPGGMMRAVTGSNQYRRVASKMSHMNIYGGGGV